jgi:hypothetical protein
MTRSTLAALVVALSVFVGLLAGSALADRTDVWSAASVYMRDVHLRKLADGGCSVQAWALYTKQDGGIADKVSQDREVSGANRTSCLDVMDVKASALFKADEGL